MEIPICHSCWLAGAKFPANVNSDKTMTDNYLTLNEEAHNLARQLFGDNTRKHASFTDRLVNICTGVQGKDFLLIHNPGGWGSTPLEQSIPWERSIVDGVTATIERLGYSRLLIQYFRSGTSLWSHIQDAKEESRFFATKAKVMAAELKFMVQHNNNLKVILIGVSQGAAFSNAVMQQLAELRQIYSIELGLFFPHMSHRIITGRTLGMDSNGVMPDPVANGNLKAQFKACITAPFRWIKYRWEGKPVKFTWCINVPGHDYDWEYPAVQQKITDFLETNFNNKNRLEVRLP